MKKDELKQEAEEKSIAEYGCKFDGFIRGYLSSAEPREKRIAELEGRLKAKEIEEHYCIPNCSQLTKAKKLLKWFVYYFREGSPNLVPYKHKVTETEQFLKGE